MKGGGNEPGDSDSNLWNSLRGAVAARKSRAKGSRLPKVRRNGDPNSVKTTEFFAQNQFSGLEATWRSAIEKHLSEMPKIYHQTYLRAVGGRLRELLSAWPTPAANVKDQAKAAGYAWRTVQRAAESIGVKRRKCSFSGGWTWELPAKEDGRRRLDPPKNRRTWHLGIFEKTASKTRFPHVKAPKMPGLPILARSARMKGAVMANEGDCERGIDAGAPVNADGTINLVHYAAWLVQQAADRGPESGG